MKTRLLLFTCAFLFALSTSARSQISSLSVNGSSTSFTMTSGDSIQWSYHVSPTGSTASIQIWYDANNNGVIDPSTDVLWQAFAQTDGDTTGAGSGPPDADRLANGVVALNNTMIGLAPGKYVLSFSQGGTTLTVTGTVAALASPAHTLSGTVTVPAGKSATNIFVGMEASGKKDNGPGWWALTNASGNFQIAMGADTSGGPWRVRIGSNPYPPAVISPQEIALYISGNPTGLNFSITTAAAQIAGTVKDDNGNLLPGADVSVYSMTGSQSSQGRANLNGLYQVGLSTANLSGNTGFTVTAYFQGSYGTTTRLDAMARTTTVNAADSVVKNLIAFTANSTITGTVKLNGANPGFSIYLGAQNPDSGQSSGMSDPTTGAFTLHVSNKIYNYTIMSFGSPYQISGGQQFYHAGQSGLVIDFLTTDVGKPSDPLPRDWSLSQNYPNPFNPTTEISYSLPAKAHVSLAVFNVLGIKVADLVDADQSAGTYSVKFGDSKLASGVYFYRIEAGGFLQTRKMVLMK